MPAKVSGRGVERCRYFSINSGVTPLAAPDCKRKSFARVYAALSSSCGFTCCITVAPQEGYTESDERPSGKLARIPPAPTAISSGEEKAPQNGSFPGGRSAGGICRGGR